MAVRNWVIPIRVRKSATVVFRRVNGDNTSAEPNMLKLEHAPPSPHQRTSRFDTLFAQLYPELFGLLYRVLGDRMETEDALQETFLKLADELDLQARPDAEVAAWLRRVGLNLSFNRLRSARRTQARLERVGRLEG